MSKPLYPTLKRDLMGLKKKVMEEIEYAEKQNNKEGITMYSRVYIELKRASDLMKD